MLQVKRLPSRKLKIRFPELIRANTASFKVDTGVVKSSCTGSRVGKTLAPCNRRRGGAVLFHGRIVISLRCLWVLRRVRDSVRGSYIAPASSSLMEIDAGWDAVAVRALPA